MNRIAMHVAIALTICLLVVSNVSGQEILAGQLGPLRLGMSMEDCLRLMGASGFSGRDDLASITGRNFISPSHDSISGLVFDRETRKLVSISVSSETAYVRSCESTAIAFSCDDWKSTSNFENWLVGQGFGVGDSVEKVLSIYNIEASAENRSIGELLVEYNDLANVTESKPRFGQTDKKEKFLYINEESYGFDHLLNVEFETGKVTAISIRTRPARLIRD